MIELLIVIAVLGFLAVAVLSAINPIEQINRSKDTASRSDAEQLISGSDRYYTQKGYYPWMGAVDDVTNQFAFNNASLVKVATNNTDVNRALTALSTNTSELKSSFITRITAGDYNPLYFFNRGLQGDSVYICFLPKSKAFVDDAWTRCGGAGGTGLPTDLIPANAQLCQNANTAYACLP
ncbi:hypothetical protein HYW55_01640 [Candidatus Gottesmanbacteria bacterium]|nr:hypothetical protein [Candidatus Gottesmanbacteria bacterium]